MFALRNLEQNCLSQVLRTRLIGRIIGKPKQYEHDITQSEAGAYFLKIRKDDPSVMTIFGTNAEVTAFNEYIMTALDLEVVTVEAEDVLSTKASRRDGLAGSEKQDYFERPYQEAEHNLARDPSVKRHGKKAKANKGPKITCEMALGMAQTLRIAEGGNETICSSSYN